MIETVTAKGNSSSDTQYRTMDNFPFNGINYYRLKLFAKDGQIITYPVKTIVFDNKDPQQLLVYPNPVEDKELNIHLSSATATFRLYVYNQQGQQVFTKQINNFPAGIKVRLPISLPRGYYMLQLANEQEAYSKKIILK